MWKWSISVLLALAAFGVRSYEKRREALEELPAHTDDHVSNLRRVMIATGHNRDIHKIISYSVELAGDIAVTRVFFGSSGQLWFMMWLLLKDGSFPNDVEVVEFKELRLDG